MLEYYQEAKKLHNSRQYASAITTFGKFLELTAEALCQHMGIGNCESGCGKVTDKMTSSNYPNDSLKLHIPRAIKAAFSIRNGRDAAHGTANMVTSPYDSLYVSAVSDWVLGELLVELGDQDREMIRGMLNSIAEKKSPIFYENSDGDLIILSNEITVGEQGLLKLYFLNRPAKLVELENSVRTRAKLDNLRKQFYNYESDFLVSKLRSGQYEILPGGIARVEKIMEKLQQ
jgi:hypothetical protein